MAFMVAVSLMVWFDGVIVARSTIKYDIDLDAAQVVVAIRAMFVLGLAAVAVACVICTRLLAMIATVASGDPFVAANGTRLTAIARTPSFASWIVVVMVFVLARVFAVGAAMRDEPEATV